MYIAYDYPLLNVFWTMLWFFLWVLWFILLFRIITDIFRDKDMSGWAKAGWLVLTILLPFLGVLVYVIARGKGMGRREIAQARAQQRDFDTYIRETAAGGTRSSSVDELARLSELRSRGHITAEGFDRAKALVLTDDRPTAGPGSSVPPTHGR
ncbi:PLDc N-terminal domain-containing protein [Streptomyces sp. cmx-10-25]|uniref:SHOCT domain-containing protein n=1 Tax=Streptomyces sp. cmx-10-25 TaxID=2790919 RepID=UPI003980CE38